VVVCGSAAGQQSVWQCMQQCGGAHGSVYLFVFTNYIRSNLIWVTF